MIIIIILFFFCLLYSTTHLDEYITEEIELPDEILNKVQVEDIKKDESIEQLQPIDDCCDDDINQHSRLLIYRSSFKYANEKKLIQQHILTLINWCKCTAIYENKPFKFWILGLNKKIYSPNYPGSKWIKCNNFTGCI